MSNAQLTQEESSLAGVKNLVFDLDGTLVDSATGIGISLKAAFQAAGREMPTGDLRSVVGPSINLIARRLEPSLTDDEVAAIERVYRADYDSNGWRSTFPFEGVVEGLSRLQSAGMRLFLITNKPRIPTDKILAHLGINGAFEAVLTRDSRTPRYATKTEMLADLRTKHAIQAAASVMVGDTQEDQEAARGNDMRFVHMACGYGTIPEASLSVEAFQALEHMLTRGIRRNEVQRLTRDLAF